MATNPQQNPKAEAKPAVQYIRAVYGRMVDPLTAQEYTSVPSELLKTSSWVESQLAAKKLELTDPPEKNPDEADAT